MAKKQKIYFLKEEIIMNKTKKLLALVFALVCIIAVAAFSSSAAEVEKIEVESWSQLRDALMAYNDNKPVVPRPSNSTCL